MAKTYYFISGLPRSGSTLLSAILKQNPRFHASISDPLHGYVKAITQVTSIGAGMEALVSVQKRREIMHSIINSFYNDVNAEVCFNTNRAWSAETALLKDLFPNFRIIICLRDIPWILDSFEHLNAKNPHTIKPLYHHQDLSNVYDRTHMLMGNVPNAVGYVSAPLANVRHSMFCSERNQLLYVEYDILVKNPKVVMQQIYEFLGESWYEHDFDNVEDSYDEFDVQAKIAGLHSVRRKIEFKPRRSILPDDLWRQYDQSTFWKNNFDSTKSVLNWAMTSVKSRNLNDGVRPILTKVNRQL